MDNWFKENDFFHIQDPEEWHVNLKLKMKEIPHDTDKFIMNIINNCPWHIFARSNVFFGNFDQVTKKILYKKGVKNILEIGTYHGLTSAILSRYVSTVKTIDINEPGCPLFIKKILWESLKINNITSYEIKDETEKEELIKTLDFDFAFIDGNHANYTYSDWMMVRKCGKVLIHEYQERQKPVWDLFNSLPREEIMLFPKDGYAYWEKKL